MNKNQNLRATLSKICKTTLLLTPIQCEQLSNKIFSTVLPKCGITSKFPASYRGYLSPRYQGLGLPHIYLEQESTKLQEFLLNSYTNSPCWKQMQLGLEVA